MQLIFILNELWNRHKSFTKVTAITLPQSFWQKDIVWKAKNKKTKRDKQQFLLLSAVEDDGIAPKGAFNKVHFIIL
jgi:hypothetical protein